MGDISIGTDISLPILGTFGISTSGVNQPGSEGVSISSFLPTQLATLTSWHNAADNSSSSIVSSGGAVSSWLDQSGGGNHLTQGVGANQPATGVETLNGLNLIAFDGDNDYMQETGTSNIADVILSDHTIFLVGVVAASLDENQCILSWNSC